MRQVPLLLLVGLLTVHCGALVAPSTDGGTGGGSGTGGGGATGGGPGAGGGGGTGGSGGTGGATGTGGGWVDTSTWPLEVADAGSWTLAPRTPSRVQQPPRYSGVTGRALPDGGAVLWAVDSFGAVLRTEDGAWTELGRPADPLEGITWAGTTLLAWSSTQLVTCNGSCATGAAFTAQPTPFRVLAACSGHGHTWVAGRSGQSLAFAEFSGGGFGAPVVATPQKDPFGCLPLADGTLLVAGDDLWRLPPGGRDVVKEDAPTMTGGQQLWRGLIEAPSGGVYAFGTFGRVAQRTPQATWRSVRQLSDQPDWLNAAVRLSSGELLFLGQLAQGPQARTQVLGLSEAAHAWWLIDRPAPVTILSAWAAPDGAVWLAGSRELNLTSEGALYRAAP